MINETNSCIFGPVPSRRLGRSLGINNIPAKHCSYSCVYCQVGRTTQSLTVRRPFYPPEQIVQTVADRLKRLRQQGEPVDYLTFVPDGEPTLDVHLGQIIQRLRPLGVPVAVITNSSLLAQEAVRRELVLADWVSVKIDSVDEAVWRRIDRPHPALCLKEILDGIRVFAQDFTGVLVTETMLVRGINDTEPAMRAVAGFLAEIEPRCAYLGIPVRPPLESWASGPDEAVFNQMYQLLVERVDPVECLIGYEGSDFSSTGDVAEDLLRITAVHPMRSEAVRLLLERTDSSWQIIDQLVEQGKLTTTEYQGRTFYLRRFDPSRPITA
jgi:wyosine [tRNA(Phe)-imidazoG37] synthetase (radical SAM superfamily)